MPIDPRRDALLSLSWFASFAAVARDPRAGDYLGALELELVQPIQPGARPRARA